MVLKTRQRKPPIVMPKNFYGVGISWDSSGDGKGVDLDLQAVIVDDKGLVVDAVYYNNLIALNGALAHSGDESSGAKEGLDEAMWLNISKLPVNVKLIIFVIAAYSTGSLQDAENGKVILCEGNVWNRVAEMDIERCQSNADIVGMIKLCRDGSWAFFEIDEPAESGSHFLDILEPNIGDIIRKEIPGAPRYQQLAFQMDKGAVMDLPQTSTLKRLCFGIGGMLPACSTKTVDIDIAAHFYNKKGKGLGITKDFESSMFGVEHGGDNDAGSGSGDDEIITMNLAEIPKKVSQVFVVMTVVDGTFADVQEVYARAVDQNANELVCYNVDAGQTEAGLAIARLFRQPGGRWGFQAIGHFFDAGYEKKTLEHIFAQDPTSQKHISKRRQSVVQPSMNDILEEQEAEKEDDCEVPGIQVTMIDDEKKMPAIHRGSTRFSQAPMGMIDGSSVPESGTWQRLISTGSRASAGAGSCASDTSKRSFFVGKPAGSHTHSDQSLFDSDPTEVILRSKGLSLTRGVDTCQESKEELAISQLANFGTMTAVGDGIEADGTENNMCNKCVSWRCVTL